MNKQLEEFDKIDEALMFLRIKSARTEQVTEKDLYDIQMSLHKLSASLTGDQAGRWVKASERLPRAGINIFIRSVHTKSGGMMWGEEVAKLDELENVEWLDESAPSEEGLRAKVDELQKKVNAYENTLMELFPGKWESLIKPITPFHE